MPAADSLARKSQMMNISAAHNMKTNAHPVPAREKRSSDLCEHRPRKREKYTRIACTLCKVRKVKCSGTQPCNRCEELHSECIYTEPPQSGAEPLRTLGMYSQSMPSNMETSVLRMNRVCEQMQQYLSRLGASDTSRPCLQRRHPSDTPTPQSRAHSPTNFRYMLNLTRVALKASGVPPTPDYNHSYPSPARDELYSPNSLVSLLQAATPVLDLGHAKTTHLLTVFKHEIYPLYPCVNMRIVQDHVDMLFSLLSRLPNRTTYSLEVIDVEIIKAVMAISLLSSGETQSSLASDLDGQLLWSIDTCYNQEQPQIEDITLATLLSLYSDLQHRPCKAWRLSRLAANLCLELGLHQEDVFEDPRMGSDQITDLKRLFACVYDADRRCSFYSGLPCTFNDSEIDASSLRLEPQDSYLSAMISLDRILAEAWSLIHSPSTHRKHNQERIKFLNFQLQKLVNTIPSDDFTPPEPTVNSPAWLRAGLKRFCRLRVHHIKLLNYIGSMGPIESLISQPQSARNLVTATAEAIDVHREITKDDSGISPLLRPLAAKLLVGAVSTMLLAVASYKEEHAELCRKHIYSALEILGNAQEIVKDPALDICGTLEELRMIADTIYPAQSQKALSVSVENQSQGGDAVHLLEAPYGGGNAFDDLDLPESDIFAMLGNVNAGTADIMFTSNRFD